MSTITIKVPEEIAAQLEAEHISQEQLDLFLTAALRAWLKRREMARKQHQVDDHSWSEAFQDSAVEFVDELIEENRSLFEELARL